MDTFRRGLNVSYPAFFRGNGRSGDDNSSDIGAIRFEN